MYCLPRAALPLPTHEGVRRFADVLDNKAAKDIDGHEQMDPDSYAEAQKQFVLGPEIQMVRPVAAN